MPKSNATSRDTPAKAIADDSAKQRPFVREFAPKSNVSVYSNDPKLTEERFFGEGKPSLRDFEPIPNDAKLTEGRSAPAEKPFVRNFDLIPNNILVNGRKITRNGKAFCERF